MAEERAWLLSASNDKEEEIVAFIENHGGDFDGLIGSFYLPENMRRLRERLPTVCVSNRTGSRELPRVISDDVEIGRMAARFYLDKGHRSFAYVEFGAYSFSRERGQGFREVLEQHGKTCANYDWAERPLEEKPQRGQAWLRGLPKPVAIFTANDAIARYVAQACLDANLTIPEEVSILGVDDDETESLLAGMPLSSVRLPFEVIGRRAAERLARLMAGEPMIRDETRIPPEGVIERLSTDVIAVDDPQLSAALRYARDAPAALNTVRAAAEHAGISVRTLQYRARRRLGRRFYEVVLDLRLARARQMLLESNRSATEIARLCGLGSLPQLSRAFRRRYGCSPRELRRRAGR